MTQTPDELVRRYLPLARRIAWRIVRGAPPNVDVNDLIGAATEGLIRAARRHDSERFPEFEPYAKAIIRGAVMDEMRRDDRLTSYGRRRTGEITRAVRELQQRLGRQPVEDEVAERLGIPIEQYQRMTGELLAGRWKQSWVPEEEELPDVEPEEAYVAVDLKRKLMLATAKLPARTQRVLVLYYQDDRTQLEIGTMLGLTESRVCQLLAEAAKQLLLLVEGRTTLSRKCSPRGACEVGQQFGCWTVLARAPMRSQNVYALCRCRCGVEREQRLSELRRRPPRACSKCRYGSRASAAVCANPVAQAAA